jgi:hypothetical protein
MLDGCRVAGVTTVPDLVAFRRHNLSENEVNINNAEKITAVNSEKLLKLVYPS